jgi:hypothetical protein
MIISFNITFFWDGRYGIWWVVTIAIIYPSCLDLSTSENRVSRFLRKFDAYLYSRNSSYPRIVTKVRMCILLRNTEIYNEINYNTNALFHLFMPPLSFIKRNSYCCTFWSLSCNFWHKVCRTLDRLHYVVVREVGQRFYKAVPCFRNKRGSSKHENVMLLTPKRKVRIPCAEFHETRTEQHYVQNCYTRFPPNG